MMKKIIFAAALLLSCGSSIAIGNSAGLTEYAVSADWEDCGTITAVIPGGVSIKRSGIPIQRNGSALRVYFNNDWRDVYNSNRSGYTYMFNVGKTSWYFNL